MDKNHVYDDIFVVLTYKNTQDILKFLNSLLTVVKTKYHVIIVNSYYDEKTKRIFENIAQKNKYDFISVENKGYGFGNNIGIKYAIDNYQFKRIIIANPDIIIKKFDHKFLDQAIAGVYGGAITTKTGKIQNPLRAKDMYLTNNTAYFLTAKKNIIMFYLSIFISKIQRLKIYYFGKDPARVFAVHGSFFILYKEILEDIEKVFDENIFMFTEEIDIANFFKLKGIPVFFTKHVEVIHEEDGDINMSSINTNHILAESSKYVYNKWEDQSK